jgi:hypothetical protein
MVHDIMGVISLRRSTDVRIYTYCVGAPETHQKVN